jgi:hypothetical protein
LIIAAARADIRTTGVTPTMPKVARNTKRQVCRS